MQRPGCKSVCTAMLTGGLEFKCASVHLIQSKTERRATTTSGIVAKMLNCKTVPFPTLPPSHTLLCSQQSLPVPVWPQQQQLKEVKQGRGRLREKGPGGECTALSAGFPLSDVYMHAHTQLAQEAACVANDQMGKDEVNLEVDQRGLPPLRIWLS